MANTTSYSKCQFCDSIAITKVGVIPYREPIKFSTVDICLELLPELWECQDCGSWFTNNILNEKTALSLYSEGSSNHKWPRKESFELNKHENIVLKLSSVLSDSMKVLDVGCNTGELLDFAKKKGCVTEGVEISKASRKILEKKGHKVYAQLEQVRDNDFDIIFAFDLVEHMYNLNKFLHDCRGLLKDDGKLIILTGDNKSLSARLSTNKWWYLCAPEHISFPSRQYLSSIKGFVFTDIVKCYASIGYKEKWFRIVKSFIYGISKNNYQGLPSIGPDHMLIELTKEN